MFEQIAQVSVINRVVHVQTLSDRVFILVCENPEAQAYRLAKAGEIDAHDWIEL